MDEIVMLLKRNNIDVSEAKQNFDIKPLNQKEKEIFFALYVLESDMGSVSYLDLSRKMSMPVSLVQAYITNLFGKGIPINKRYSHDKVCLTLDKEFREHQARKNLVGITETISQKISLI